MASWAEAEGFEGIADWLYSQAEEETEHMMKIIHYVNDRGAHAVIPAFDQPPKQWNDVFILFDEVLKHEQYITESINEIVALAEKEKDYATLNWLQWFVDEQVEEESSVQQIIDKLNLLGDKNLYIFDRDIMKLRGEEAGEAEK